MLGCLSRCDMVVPPVRRDIATSIEDFNGELFPHWKICRKEKINDSEYFFFLNKTSDIIYCSSDIALLLLDDKSILKAEHSLDLIQKLIKCNVLSDNLHHGRKIDLKRITEGKLNAPLWVFWEITSHCNLNCIHCFSNSSFNTKKEDFWKSKIKIKEIINSFADMGVLKVGLTGGEPFYDFTRLLYILKNLKNNKIGIHITTNGSLITEKIAIKLKNLSVNDISVSIDGFPFFHDKIRLQKGIFLKALRGFKILKKVGLEPSITSVKFEEFGNITSSFIKFIEDLEPSRHFIQPLMPSGRASNLNLRSLKNNKKCINGCIAGTSAIAITSDGKVKPCSFIKGNNTILGDLVYKSLNEIWNKIHH